MTAKQIGCPSVYERTMVARLPKPLDFVLNGEAKALRLSCRMKHFVFPANSVPRPFLRLEPFLTPHCFSAALPSLKG